ncbi:response regulator [uncultured Thermanaerothrix sp.]|uniref:response regulator n=1 Tax=uncultured Thermanaerothrix sp. TaxID=1195149 RepID=UPI002634EA0B|nr:response regulator [uncultured Thermanaerothrix sp.]
MSEVVTPFTLLIIEDDLDVAEMLATFFKEQGYRVLTANWGEDGIRTATEQLPHLVILDIRLPDIDGFEVARRLRARRRTRYIPIIFLTEKRERQDKLQGLQLEADDYITKPFDIRELGLRVRNALSRARRESLTHPVTGLPQGALVEEALAHWLATYPALSLWVVGLRHLEAFREAYGFVAADDALRAVALLLGRQLLDAADDSAFLGHLDLTTFVLIVTAGPRSGLGERLARQLDQALGLFYRSEDLQEGRFEGSRLSVVLRSFAPSTLPDSVAGLRAALLELVEARGA